MSTLPTVVEASDGRRFAVRELTPADVLDVLEAAGHAASSPGWMRYAIMICSVHAIDGVPVMMPVTKEGVRELARRIGNSGVEALSQALHPPEADDEAALLATAKN